MNTGRMVWIIYNNEIRHARLLVNTTDGWYVETATGEVWVDDVDLSETELGIYERARERLVDALKDCDETIKQLKGPENEN